MSTDNRLSGESIVESLENEIIENQGKLRFLIFLQFLLF